jgi:hypothetical protein
MFGFCKAISLRLGQKRANAAYPDHTENVYVIVTLEDIASDAFTGSNDSAVAARI